MTILLFGRHYIIIKLLNGYIWINVQIITLVYRLYRLYNTSEQFNTIGIVCTHACCDNIIEQRIEQFVVDILKMLSLFFLIFVQMFYGIYES